MNTEEEKDHGNQYTGGKGGNTTFGHNDVPYLLRRLARKRPDLFEAYQAALALLLFARSCGSRSNCAVLRRVTG
jgi:hypothetical protein